MADLDSPLKQLVSAFIIDFAAWLLQADVREAHPIHIERLRFDPPISVYQQLARYLETITDEAQLEKLLAVAARGESVADFQAAMREE